MQDEGIPDDVRELLLEHVDTVAQLEILLLLHDSRPEVWPADRVAQRLALDPRSAAARLADLADRGFFSTALDGDVQTWTYAPTSPAMDAVVQRLGRAYKERRVAVISLIFSRPPDPLRHFSDAFKLRKSKDRKD